MDVPSWLALLLLVVPSLAVVRELFFVNQPMSWTDAQSYCREKLLDLVTVANQGDWARVSGMVADSAAGAAWIGLYDDVNSWRWSLNNTSIYQDGTTNLGSWFTLSVDNNNGDEYCAYMHQGGFFDSKCQSGWYFICYNEPTNTYHGVHSGVIWPEAQRICRETYTDLASVRSQAELDVIKAAFYQTGYWWVGLSRVNWTWSDQSKYSFEAWVVGQPSAGRRDCVYADATGWTNDDCLTERPFICSTPISKVIKVVMKINGPTDPNKPQILAALLKQRETLLREQGIDQEVKLKWREVVGGVVFNKTEL